MLALTMHQPWASLVAAGLKRWETRSKPPGGMAPKGQRALPGKRLEPGDRLHIHTSAHVPGYVHELLSSRHGDELRGICHQWLDDFTLTERDLGLPHGVIVASVRVPEALRMLPAGGEPLSGSERCVIIDRGDIWTWPDMVSITDQRELGDWRPTRWAWRLDDLEVLDEPVPAVGRQGIWEVG
jgi:hypothetical protein